VHSVKYLARGQCRNSVAPAIQVLWILPVQTRNMLRFRTLTAATAVAEVLQYRMAKAEHRLELQ